MKNFFENVVSRKREPRRKGTGGRARAMIVIAALALATSAMAKIGETPDQIIQRSQRDKDIIEIRADYWKGKSVLDVHYRDGSFVTHLFGMNGRQIAMYSYLPKRLTNKDIVKIQQLYPTVWYGTGTANGLFSWESASGLLMTAQRYEKADSLLIYDLSKLAEIPEGAPSGASSTPAPVIDFVPDKPATAADTKDCLIVATEAQARLKPTAYWSRIAAFTWIDDKETGGHAVVFYQPTQDSNVFMYDKTIGSLDLQTQSHDLTQLTSALNQIFRSSNAGVQSPRWIGG